MELLTTEFMVGARPYEKIEIWVHMQPQKKLRKPMRETFSISVSQFVSMYLC